MKRFYDGIVLVLILLIVILLFRVGMGVHKMAVGFTGELPAPLTVGTKTVLS